MRVDELRQTIRERMPEFLKSVPKEKQPGKEHNSGTWSAIFRKVRKISKKGPVK